MPKDIINLARQYVSNILGDMKEKGFMYHNLKHTIEVLNRATYIAQQEDIDDEELEIIQLWALFHDIWFIRKYEQNEPIWAQIAEGFLIENNYPTEKVKKVKEIIITTSPFLEPKCKLWEILKDADLDNMWRDDFLSKNMLLRYECKFIKGLKISEDIRLEKTLDFLEKINIYTSTQKKKEKEVSKKTKNSSETYRKRKHSYLDSLYNKLWKLSTIYHCIS